MNREHPGPKISSSSSSEFTHEKLEERQASTLRSCPSCGHEIDCNTDMIGMPEGVKFDPSDQELIHHLQAMVDEEGSRAHPFIGEFIPTLQGDDGINTHPENLPGVRRDGLSKYFFHRSSKAYANGTRKRRKIYAQRDLNSSDNAAEMRWHKTGKTRPVIVGGRQEGCKKIMVLYINYGKHRKPEKSNWVMHQYHLGDQEEKDGELVVSKVFYQTQTRQQVAAAVAPTAEQHIIDGGKADETSDAKQDVVSRCAVATTTSTMVMMQQRQHQQASQTDVLLSVAHSRKRCHDEEEKQQQNKIEQRSAGLAELIKGASTQSETKRLYQYWPPDRDQEQHG